MRAEDLRAIDLFEGLSLEQLGQLVEAGREVPIVPGEVLWSEGGYADSWWVVIDGAVDLLRRTSSEEMVVGRMDAPGRWAGGFRAWVASGVYLATAVGAEPGRLLEVPASALKDLTDSWFPFGGHLIRGLYGLALYVEATARQRDSLATLGKLAAGLAHEINNPAAAAARAVDSLGEADDRLLSSLTELGTQGLSSAEFVALDALRRDLAARPAPLRVDFADIEEALAERLESEGIDRSWALAPVLAAANADEAWCERLSTTLEPGARQAGLDWIVSSLESTALRAQIAESTRRISELVTAVRSYSQVDRAPLQDLDVREGIESTLLVLGHRLKEGVEVVRDLGEDTPRIHGYAGELNQVWTNLIDNAIDAMDGRGTLRITTRADEDGGVVVEVADTGTGLSAEEAARAFEPFFTTKPVGMGTGLGLDIAHRIVVERHGGAIEIVSQPGDTVMRVRLPDRPPSR